MSRGVTTCACGEPAYDGCTQCALCSSDGGLFTPAPALPDVPYSGLEQRFFQGLNTITRRAVLQVLGGHSDAFMEQVRNRGDERRLFKHLFKAAPVQPSAVPDTEVFAVFRNNCAHYAGNYEVTPGQAVRIAKHFAAPSAQGAVPSTGYAKHGYILQAADGQQTWLKGDPADGMGRYGKIIQLYRKEGV